MYCRVALVVFLSFLSGCASEHHPVSGPTAPPRPVAVQPTRASITAAVQTAFSHMTTASAKTLWPVVANDFGKDSHSMQSMLEYMGASDVITHLDDIRGRTADVSVNYQLISDNKTKFLFTRRDTLTFVHGRAGWLMDSMRVSDKVLRAMIFPDGTRDDVTDSRFDPTTGNVTFTDRGMTIAWMPNYKSGGWKISILSTPTAAPVAQTATLSPAPEAPAPPPANGAPAYVPPAYVPPAGGGESDCEDVSVQGVYADGEILELDDGRKLRVSDGDQAVSSVWVAPFDGMICDAGGTFINKDDNEKVDLSP